MDRTLSAFTTNETRRCRSVNDLVMLHLETTSRGPFRAGRGSCHRRYGAEHESPFLMPSLTCSSRKTTSVFEEGISQGGAMVIARVDESQMDQAIDIMESHNPVDLDERGSGAEPKAIDRSCQPG